MAVGRNTDSNKIVLEVKVDGQAGNLSEADRQLLSDFKENSANILKKTKSDDILLANGETLSKEKLKGERGERGLQGAQGIQGVQGQRGERGLRGEQGANGKSAYQIAVDNGFQGDETAWLESLKGQSISEDEKQKLIRKDELGEHIELYSKGQWHKAMKIDYDKQFIYPQEFEFKPFEVLHKNGKFMPQFGGIWDEFVKAKAETMTKYYVNPDTGKDTNDGLTPQTALRSVTDAINVKGCRYIEIATNNGVIQSNYDLKDLNIIGDEPLIIVAPNQVSNGGLLPSHFFISGSTKEDEAADIWKIANISWVIGMFEHDQEKSFNIDRNSLLPYKKFDSLEELKEKGSFPAYYYDAETKSLYIKQNHNESISSTSYIHIQKQLNFNIKGNVPFIYTQGINFYNVNNVAGLRVHNSAAQQNTRLFFSGCGFKFNPLGGGLQTINVKEVWLENTQANDNKTFGFEYLTASGKEKTKVVEINSKVNNVQNASKLTGGEAIVRINCKYSETSQESVLDRGENSNSLNLNANGDYVLVENKAAFKASGAGTKQWLFDCNSKSHLPQFLLTETESGAKQFLNNVDNYQVANLSGDIEQVPLLTQNVFKKKETVDTQKVYLRVVGEMIEYSYDNVDWEMLFPIKMLKGQTHRKTMKIPTFKQQKGLVYYKLGAGGEWTLLCRVEDFFAKEHGIVITPSDVIGDRLNYYKVLFAVNHKVLVLAGKYEFDCSNVWGVKPKSGSWVRFSQGAHWKMRPTKSDVYSLLWMGDFIANDIVVEGGFFEGDKWEHGYRYHEGQTFNEWGHGVCFSGARNIILRDMKFARFPGDGILIGGLFNSRFYNAEIEDCRREGIFVGSCNDVEIHNYRISNISSPYEKFVNYPGSLDPGLPSRVYRSLSYGINCEPDYADRHIDGLRLYNCVFDNNEGYRCIGLNITSHNSATPPWYRKGKPMDLIMKVEVHHCEFHKDMLHSSCPTDNSVGYVRVIKPRFYNSKQCALYFSNHISANYHTEVDNPKFYDCTTRRITRVGATEKPTIAPIAFNITEKDGTISAKQAGVGIKNIRIVRPEFYAKDEASFKDWAISFNQDISRLADMENVEIIEALLIGYKDVFNSFDKNSISPKHPSFTFTLHPDCQFVKKTGDLIVDNTFSNTFIDKSDAGNVIFKDAVPVTGVEHFVKNSSTGEVKLKFESPTDIEGLAYGIQEFALARGKRLKMRKIDANRWEYLEGTA
ncbi:right-handed parallel beta-helix repeat-containing protein [Capnocytophaga sp.]|uniref:right-handed parallel beta-helix repeat-containing protein n=1 Tax=Capnocytophaga sp. TaxID=44737 RepID=UPI0026DCF1B6|nr:right-handed parallel beta-helix repeat-containing protein [Capnocytophaga sp.]MDO5106491.1 right-handed parallel beta-helix repeat-containing protein [Capnocytophaga sp.]